MHGLAVTDMTMRNLHPRLAVITTAVMTLSLLVAPSAHAHAPATPAPAAQAAFTDPDRALGPGWRSSPDVAVAGAGDTEGFHLWAAREKDAFAWHRLATLTSSALEGGAWIGETCVTGSGRYAVAVFEPAMATNKPALAGRGALAAVVEIATGQARRVASGVQLAYFGPGCGPGDRVLLTREVADGGQTDLLSVDAVAGTVTSTRQITGQFTNPAPGPDGDYGVVGGKVVKVDERGRVTTVAEPAGTPFAVHATAHSGIDIASVRGGTAYVQRLSAGHLSQTATAPSGGLQMFGLPGGATAIAGKIGAARPNQPELTAVPSERRPVAVSARGHLVVESASSLQAAQSARQPLTRPNPGQAGALKVTVRATHSGRTASGSVAGDHAPRLDVLPTTRNSAAPALATDQPKCLVPRNDPKVQALQPSPDMVEWAVDQAVHGQLTVGRPADYLKTGMPAYSPQGMFPLASMPGGKTVPAQVMLGILAQETNLAEASWHAVRGDLGNPLVSDYYGNRAVGYDQISYADADCGYGIGQVTTGMARTDTTQYTPERRVAIATDYAANIAASLNVLIDKWHQANDGTEDRTWVNNADPSFVENWYIAVWAYNSGFHSFADRNLPDNQGRYGIGWLNNPANPKYDPQRHKFLADPDDAAHPERWPYQEKVMGWAETPQVEWNGPLATPKYAPPDFGGSSGRQLTLPTSTNDGYFMFCSPSVNSCSKPTQPGQSACPANSPACWWRGQATFATCPAQCATEHLTYSASSPEPGVKRIYDRDCDDSTVLGNPDWDKSRAIKLVYTLNDTSRYALGCPEMTPQFGKFTLRLGDPAGVPDQAAIANIDLHQLGAGWRGHIWFTHIFPDNDARFAIKKVVATWTPRLAPEEAGEFDIMVHLPSHGGNAPVDYEIARDAGPVADDAECHIDQAGTLDPGDRWVYLKHQTLKPGARVLLSNAGSTLDTDKDVGFDAVAFVPVKPGTGHSCHETA